MEDSPNLPDISLWDFLDGYSYLITEISASIHNAIGAFPQDNSLPIRIMVILILNKVKQDKKKDKTQLTEKKPKIYLTIFQNYKALFECQAKYGSWVIYISFKYMYL